jgi:hypothetical protein
MGWPEWTLTSLQAANLIFAAFTVRDVPKFAGATLGFALVVFLLYQGGFYN